MELGTGKVLQSSPPNTALPNITISSTKNTVKLGFLNFPFPHDLLGG